MTVLARPRQRHDPERHRAMPRGVGDGKGAGVASRCERGDGARPSSPRLDRHRQLRASCATPAAATTTSAPRRRGAAPTTSARDIRTTRRSTPTACAAARPPHRGPRCYEARRRDPRTPTKVDASRVTRAGAAPTAPRRPTAEATASARASPTTPPSTRAASAAPGRDVRLPSSFP